MNYLDLLPNDVMKIINREIQNAHIIKRRIERKQERNMNREQKRKAGRKRYIYEHFARLYNKYTYVQEYKEYSKRVDDHYIVTQRIHNIIREKYGTMLLHSEECIGGDEPYILATYALMVKFKRLNSNSLFENV